MAPDPVKIVITGFGLVSGWGVGAEAFRAGLATGTACAGPLVDFDAKTHLGAKGLRRIDRVSRFTLVAAQEALGSAGFTGDTPRTDVGVALGSAFSGLDSIMGFFTERLTEGANYVTASNFGNIVMNAAASQVALRFGLPALNATVTSGGASGLDALGWAYDMVRAGRAGVVLAGGVEEISTGSLAVIAARARAFTPGEGAALLALESQAHAAARGATALAEVAGYAQAFDPGPAAGKPSDPVHAARAVAQALAAAGLTAAEVDWVVGSADQTPELGGLEAAALAQLGLTAPLLAPKLWLGETLGAAGALAAVVATLALRGEPVAGLSATPRTVLVTAFDPDGHQAALILRAVS